MPESAAPLVESRLVAEAFGTFMLCLTVLCNVVAGTSATFAALSIASVLMIMVYSLGSISGAHLNPAVTLSITLAKQLDYATSAKYIGAQVFGAISAAVVSYAIFSGGVAVTPGLGHTWYQAGAAELLYTCMLCFVVLNVACCKANADNEYFGLAIGYVITAAGYAVGGVSGANLNPAVSLAIDLGGLRPFWSPVYIVFQLAGAAAAFGLFSKIHPEDCGMPKAVGDMPAYLAEFLGTFYLVLTAGCCIVGGTLSGALAIGSALMCMIYALGSVSGAHFNPAVTLAIAISGRNKIDTKKAAHYVGFQCLGAITAGLVFSNIVYRAAAGIGPVRGWLPLAEAEILFTAVLCYVVLAVATVKKPSKDMFGLAIGMCVTVGGFAAGAAGGGVLNPAAALGLGTAALVKGAPQILLNSLGYTALECAGGALAAGVFMKTHESEYSGK